MKLIISTPIAVAAFISEKRTYASDRNEYYNSLFAKAGATPDANRGDFAIVQYRGQRMTKRRSYLSESSNQCTNKHSGPPSKGNTTMKTLRTLIITIPAVRNISRNSEVIIL